MQATTMQPFRRTRHGSAVGGYLALAISVGALAPCVGRGGDTAFFNSNQVATLVATGTTSDTVSSEGYQFTYTRDKLFTGGYGMTNPIGRPVRVPWPQGVEAQAVTTGPQPGGARITLRRVDGTPFDVTALSFKLLANTAGAGARLEIMPVANGEDAFKDPLYFEASGYYGSVFSYDTSPGIWGSTAALTNYAAYKIGLYVDFALVALQLYSVVPNVNHAPTDLAVSGASVPENEPPGMWVGTFSTSDPDAGDVFAYDLVAGPGSADNGSFEISGGDLFATAAFNYELKSNYTIRVRTTDAGLLATQKVFAIDVVDVDEPPPDFLAPGGSAEAGVEVSWSSLPNHLYTLYASTNLTAGFTVLQDNIEGTPPLNTYTDRVTSAAYRFWRIGTGP